MRIKPLKRVIPYSMVVQLTLAKPEKSRHLVPGILKKPGGINENRDLRGISSIGKGQAWCWQKPKGPKAFVGLCTTLEGAEQPN